MTPKALLTAVLLHCLLPLAGFSQSNWQQRADLPSIPRTGNFYFAAGGFGFIGCGEDSNFVLKNEVWRYNPNTDTWQQMSNFPGASRKFATAFSLNGKGYAGTGLSDTSLMKDFWAYDPATDVWSSVQDLGTFVTPVANPRRDASSASLFNFGYVICGYDGTSGFAKQLYSFDPTADTMWRKKKNFTNLPDQTTFGRRWGVAFELNSKLYYGTGFSSSNDSRKDVWSYDPIRDLWTQVADFAGDARSNAVAVVSYNRAYVGAGSNDILLKDFYRYNSSLNTWTYVADYPHTACNLSAFTINDRMFVGLGNDSAGVPFGDFYEFTPDTTIGFNDAYENLKIDIHPTVVSDRLTISSDQFPRETLLTLYSIDGKKIGSYVLNAGTNEIMREGDHSGLVMFSITVAGKNLKAGKLIFSESR